MKLKSYLLKSGLCIIEPIMFHMEISDKLLLLTQIHSTNRMCAAFTLFERAEFLHVDFSQCVLHGSLYFFIYYY